MKKHLNLIQATAGCLLAAGALALPAIALGQPITAGHYPAGAEGIKGASLPPPGIYARDYNFFYYSDKFRDGPPDFNISAYLNAPRVIWMSGWKIFGADYGADLIVPFGYMDWEFQTPGGKVKDHYFGLGDIQVEPLLLSWHFKQFDLAAGYAFWAPTGDFDVNRPDLFAKGFWSHMLTLGGTWYADAEKTWAVSLLNRYEFAHEQQDTHNDPGQVFTAEWGLSKMITRNWDVGLIGYYQQQTTRDSGPTASDKLDRKVGIGPEVATFCPVLGTSFTLRYAYEFGAEERPEGHLLVLTLTKRF